MRSWFATALACALVAIGPVAGATAHAEETTEPTPSAEATSSQSAESAKPSPTASETAEPEAKEPSAKAEKTEAPEPTKKATVSSSARPKATAKATLSSASRLTVQASAAKEGTRYEYAPGVEYWVPAQWTVGAELVLSGSGWRNIAGDEGSIIAVKLDDGGVSTKAEVKHPVTGAVQGNKTIYAIVQADAEGDLTLRLPYPTADNSTATWSTGESHKVTLLTGSLLVGDVIRSASANSTVSAASTPTPTPSETPTPTPTPSDTPSPTPSQTPTPDPTPTPTEPESPSPTPTRPASRRRRPRR